MRARAHTQNIACSDLSPFAPPPPRLADRSVFFDVYAGLDCSFVRPFAGARGAGGAALGLAAALAASLLLLLAHFPI